MTLLLAFQTMRRDRGTIAGHAMCRTEAVPILVQKLTGHSPTDAVFQSFLTRCLLRVRVSVFL